MPEPSECPSCRLPVVVVPLAGGGPDVVLDAIPDPEHGQAIVSGGECKFVTQPDQWAVVKQFNLPVYRRHNTHCREFWFYRVHPGLLAAHTEE